MKIVFDLDGVLRDLTGHISRLYKEPYPTVWDVTYQGKSIYTCINEDVNILLDSPPTAYLRVALKYCSPLEIWTSQSSLWQPYTTSWIHNHIGEATTIRFLKTEEKEAELRKNKDTILVEDCPNFKSYDGILLIDRPYNQGVKKVARVFGTKHLKNMLELL